MRGRRSALDPAKISLESGDLAHHWVISVQHPAWSIEVDADRPAADAMRQQTLVKLAADHARVFAVHFPFPGVGYVVADGRVLVWRPDHHAAENR